MLRFKLGVFANVARAFQLAVLLPFCCLPAAVYWTTAGASAPLPHAARWQLCFHLYLHHFLVTFLVVLCWNTATYLVRVRALGTAHSEADVQVKVKVKVKVRVAIANTDFGIQVSGLECRVFAQSSQAATCPLSYWCHFQVIQSERHVFAPPDSDPLPTSTLLTALTVDPTSPQLSFLRHLAFLDLCHLAEDKGSSWRRAALFEETGSCYDAAIRAVVGPVNALTLRLTRSLHQSQPWETTSAQMMDPDAPPRPAPNASLFQDYQVRGSPCTAAHTASHLLRPILPLLPLLPFLPLSLLLPLLPILPILPP